MLFAFRLPMPLGVKRTPTQKSRGIPSQDYGSIESISMSMYSSGPQEWRNPMESIIPWILSSSHSYIPMRSAESNGSGLMSSAWRKRSRKSPFSSPSQCGYPGDVRWISKLTSFWIRWKRIVSAGQELRLAMSRKTGVGLSPYMMAVISAGV